MDEEIAQLPLIRKFNFLLLQKTKHPIMGKGDKRSKRGKIRIGSTGVTRPRKKKKKAAKKEAPVKVAVPKKAAAKKAPAKKAAKGAAKKAE
jgi:30S ribosomal protein S31